VGIRLTQRYRWSIGWIIAGALCLSLGATLVHGERDLALAGPTMYPAPGAPAISNGIVIVRDGVYHVDARPGK